MNMETLMDVTGREIVYSSCTGVDKKAKNDDDTTNMFDYEAYTQFWSLKSRLEKYRRRRSIGLGKSVMKLEDYSDQVLQREMEKQYGMMDTASQMFSTLFFRYKTQRLAQLKKWMSEEKKLQNLEAFPLKEINTKISNCKEKLKWYTFRKDYQEERDFYGCDWFELPRKTITLYSNTVSEVKIKMGKKNRHQQLTTFPLAIEEDNLSLTNGKIFNRRISSQLSIKLYLIINHFPLGVTEKVFLRRFKEIHGHLPNFLEKFYRTFLDMCRHCDDIFCVPEKLSGMDQQLLFPASLIDSPEDINYFLAKIKHYIKAVVSLNLGNIEVDKVMSNIKYTFGIDIKPENWEFDNSLEFVQFIVKNDQDLKIYYLLQGEYYVYYLCFARHMEKIAKDLRLNSKPEIEAGSTNSNSYNEKRRIIYNIDNARIRIDTPDPLSVSDKD